MCVHENIELSIVTKTKVEFIHNFRRYLLSYNDNATIRKVQNNFRVAKAGILLPRGGTCHPIATGLDHSICVASGGNPWIVLAES